MALLDFQTATTEAGSHSAGIVAIVGSAGAIGALFELLGGLPKPFPMPILVAQHLARHGRSLFPELLEWRTGFSAKWAKSGEKPKSGEIYVVPPGCRLQLKNRRLRISPLADTAIAWLPSVDDLLESVAEAYQSRATAIILSGMLPVGIAGMRSIVKQGGLAMAQNERSSEYFEMPMAARDRGKADIILSPRRIAEALCGLAGVCSETRLHA